MEGHAEERAAVLLAHDVDVLPDQGRLGVAGDLEDAAAMGVEGEDVAVGEHVLHTAGLAGQAPVAAAFILPDDRHVGRVELEHAAAAAGLVAAQVVGH